MKRMKYVLGLVLAVALMLLAVPARAATVESQVTSGPFAEAFFTTAPVEEPPTPGVVYTDVSVYGSDQLTPDSGGVAVPFASIDVYRYFYDAEGIQPMLVSETFGGTNENVNFTADRRLATATLTATFDVLKQITPDNPGGGPVAGGTVSISWTANGPVMRLTSTEKVKVPGGGVYLSKDTVTSRAASATGSVLGTEYTDSIPFGTEIANEVMTERLLTH